jgi:hypothetical protein
MNKEDLKLGRTYRGKHPAKNLLGDYNDRTIIYLGNYQVQYDSISVRDNCHYPTITIEKFLKWADREV